MSLWRRSRPTASSEPTSDVDATLAEEWRRFAESTSIRTLPKTLRSQTCCWKFIWIFALVVGAVVAAYQLYVVIATYLQYETSFHVEERFEAPPFPDITVCKMNPPPAFEASVVEDYIDNVDSSLEEIKAEQLRARDPDLDYDEETLQLVSELGSLTGFYQTVDPASLQLSNLSDFIFHCSYISWNSVQQSCRFDANATSWFLTPELPTCITLAPRNVSRDGLLGFTGIFYLDDFATLDAPSLETSLMNAQARGVRVFLSEPDAVPDVLLGAPVGSGTQATLRVSSHLTKRQTGPYGACTPANASYTSQIYGHTPEQHERTSTQTECEYRCRQSFILKHCACLDPEVPSTREDRARAVFCGALEEGGANISRTVARTNCRTEKLKQLQDACSESCLPLCTEYSFGYQKLDVAWPHESRHLSLYRDYIRNRTDIRPKFGSYYEDVERLLRDGFRTEAFDMLRGTDLISRNLLQINIHFDHRKVTVSTDTVTLSTAALFGQMGGILNLWIGITFVTLVELGEFFYRATVAVAHSLQRRHGLSQVRAYEPPLASAAGTPAAPRGDAPPPPPPVANGRSAANSARSGGVPAEKADVNSVYETLFANTTFNLNREKTPPVIDR